jgi:biopolymer transport protein TolQ
MDGTDVLTTALNAQSHDLSLYGLFIQAHIVVKIVMIGLVIASVWCWGIVIDKYLMFSRNKKAMDRFERVFWSGQSLEELYTVTAQRTNTTMAALFVAAMREWKRSHERNARSIVGCRPASRRCST